MDAKELIKSKVDIADLISGYLVLKSSGVGSFKGLCPFHAERTPSFHVSKERQIFKCFGCDKGGDIFTFLMEMEGIDFSEALKQLAEKSGVELPKNRPNEIKTVSTALVSQALELAAKYYQATLNATESGKFGRQYLEQRGITTSDCERFRLGVAPLAWTGLFSALAGRGVTPETMLKAGLISKRVNAIGFYDRFRNRLMIPLCDLNGGVVGFTARQLPGGDTEQAKYINSPESEVYHKGKLLYGLHLAKLAIKKLQEVIVVEGNLDVISSHRAGVENVVGSSGTAITHDQLKLLTRYCKRIIFCLDHDKAGDEALKRVINLVYAFNDQQVESKLGDDLEVRVIGWSQEFGKDPDELIAKDSEQWRRIVLQSKPVVDYFFELELERFETAVIAPGGGKEELKAKLIDNLIPYLRLIRRPDLLHLYLLRLADLTQVSQDILRAMVTQTTGTIVKASSTLTSTPAAKFKPSQLDPSWRAGAVWVGLGVKNPAIWLERVKSPILTDLPELWATLYSAGEAVYNSTQIDQGEFTTDFYQRLRAYLDEHSLSPAVQALDSAVLYTDEIFAGLSPKLAEEEMLKGLGYFIKISKNLRKRELEAEIREAERRGDQTQLDLLMNKFQSLMKD